MKNQYFGDNRDLFKYDLIYQIIQAGLVKHFMFIPMLTKNDDTGQGGVANRDKAKAGKQNKELVNFLDKYVNENKRDVKQLKSFFEKKTIKTTIYEKDFCHERRDEYFEEIGNKLLTKSLVFVDPDIGLEVKRLREKHIRYKEVQYLCKRMDKSSVLMIFQFIPREKRETCLRRISKRLKEEAGNLPIYISDNQVVFFFLAKDNFLRESLGKEISNYGETHHLRVEIT